MTDFDRISLDRLLPSTPGSADWEDVLRRSGARHGGRRRRLVVLAVVALVAVATASAFAVRAFVPDKAIVGLPPVGATPSTPASGVLEMYFWVTGARATGLCASTSWVYADGRLIRLGADRANGSRAAASSSNASHAKESSSCDPRSSRREGSGTPSRLPAASPSTPRGRPRSRCARVTGSSASGGRGDLKRLEARLTDPESWLPASAWKQRKVRAYVPSRFAVCAAAVVVPDLDKPRQGRIVQMGHARIVALLPEAAQNVFRGRDWNARGFLPGSSCFAATTNEARSLAKALDGAGPATARKGGAIRLHYTFDAPGPSRQVWISFDPFLPHGEITCSQCG